MFLTLFHWLLSELWIFHNSDSTISTTNIFIESRAFAFAYSITQRSSNFKQTKFLLSSLQKQFLFPTVSLTAQSQMNHSLKMFANKFTLAYRVARTRLPMRAIMCIFHFHSKTENRTATTCVRTIAGVMSCKLWNRLRGCFAARDGVDVACLRTDTEVNASSLRKN